MKPHGTPARLRTHPMHYDPKRPARPKRPKKFGPPGRTPPKVPTNSNVVYEALRKA